MSDEAVAQDVPAEEPTVEPAPEVEPKPKRQPKKSARPPKPKGPLARKAKTKPRAKAKRRTARAKRKIVRARKRGYLAPKQRRKADPKNLLVRETRELLRRALKQSGASRSKLAAATGRSPNWAAYVVSEKSAPSLQTIDHFARSLGYKASLHLSKIGRAAPTGKKSRKSQKK